MRKISLKEYDVIHHWMYRNFGKARLCEKCGLNKLPKGYKRFFNWANISGSYLKDRKDWQQLCMRCHKRIDAAVLIEENVKEIRQLYMQKNNNQYELAKMFNVSQPQIHKIVANKQWVLV